MSVTGAIIAGVGAASSIGAAAIGSHAAGKAADTQASTANYAANLQSQDAQKALDFQKLQWETNQKNLAPWLSTGQNALGSLGYLMGINPQSNSNTNGPSPGTAAGDINQPLNPGFSGSGTTIDPNNPAATLPAQGVAMGTDANGNPVYAQPSDSNPADATGTTTGTVASTTGTQPFVNTNLGSYGSLMKPWDEQFTAPTDVTEKNDPGYQFRLKQGEDALQASAAAKGNLFSGGTMKALGNYAQDYASSEYGNAYNRAFNEYAQRYNQFQTNNTNQYNRLSNLAGMGQTTANQLGLLGQNAANNTSSILLNSGQQIGNDIQNAGAARASGYVGSANAWGGALNGISGNLTNLMLLNALNQNGTIAVGATGCWVAAELYGGWTNARTIAVRRFLFSSTLPRIQRFAARYLQEGQEWAAQIRKDPDKRARFRRLFDGFLQEAAA